MRVFPRRIALREQRHGILHGRVHIVRVVRLHDAPICFHNLPYGKFLGSIQSRATPLTQHAHVVDRVPYLLRHNHLAELAFEEGDREFRIVHADGGDGLAPRVVKIVTVIETAVIPDFAGITMARQ